MAWSKFIALENSYFVALQWILLPQPVKVCSKKKKKTKHMEFISLKTEVMPGKKFFHCDFKDAFDFLGKHPFQSSWLITQEYH